MAQSSKRSWSPPAPWVGSEGRPGGCRGLKDPLPRCLVGGLRPRHVGLHEPVHGGPQPSGCCPQSPRQDPEGGWWGSSFSAGHVGVSGSRDQRRGRLRMRPEAPGSAWERKLVGRRPQVSSPSFCTTLPTCPSLTRSMDRHTGPGVRQDGSACSADLQWRPRDPSVTSLSLQQEARHRRD